MHGKKKKEIERTHDSACFIDTTERYKTTVLRDHRREKEKKWSKSHYPLAYDLVVALRQDHWSRVSWHIPESAIWCFTYFITMVLLVQMTQWSRILWMGFSQRNNLDMSHNGNTFGCCRCWEIGQIFCKMWKRKRTFLELRRIKLYNSIIGWHQRISNWKSTDTGSTWASECSEGNSGKPTTMFKIIYKWDHSLFIYPIMYLFSLPNI